MQYDAKTLFVAKHHNFTPKNMIFLAKFTVCSRFNQFNPLDVISYINLMIDDYPWFTMDLPSFYHAFSLSHDGTIIMNR